VRNKVTKRTICLADDIVFVQVDPKSRKAIPHGKTFEQLTKQTEIEIKTLNR